MFVEQHQQQQQRKTAEPRRGHTDSLDSSDDRIETTITTDPAAVKIMDESAATFGPTSFGNTSASGPTSSRRGSSTVMITDALSDVRVHYHIDPKEIGHGHYGVVRKCQRRNSNNINNEWLAIKSIRKSKVSKIEVLKREIDILREVRHPHIIELVDVYEDERYLHLITELCTGGELFDRIIAKTQSAEGHFSEHDAAKLVRDILDAIRYCHDKGIGEFFWRSFPSATQLLLLLGRRMPGGFAYV
jgi:hypothetical protein